MICDKLVFMCKLKMGRMKVFKELSLSNTKNDYDSGGYFIDGIPHPVEIVCYSRERIIPISLLTCENVYN